jgi:hypothetical protein
MSTEYDKKKIKYDRSIQNNDVEMCPHTASVVVYIGDNTYETHCPSCDTDFYSRETEPQ